MTSSQQPLCIDLHDVRVIRPLGGGATSKVYHAVHVPTGVEYAVKVFSKSEVIRRRKVKRVRTETELLLSIDHPFIVTLHHTARTESCLFLFLEYAAAGTLHSLVWRAPQHRVSEEIARFVAEELVQAFEYLHIRGFVHRDLKPENVLLTPSGHIRLSDFDLAMEDSCSVATCSVSAGRRSGVAPVVKELQRSNSFVGTPEYMAPEMLRDSGHGLAVDWWALGILLYEILVGKSPFKGTTDRDTYRNVLQASALTFPVNVALSVECKTCIRQLLLADSSKRLGSGVRGVVDIKSRPWFQNVNFGVAPHPPPEFVRKCQLRASEEAQKASSMTQKPLLDVVNSCCEASSPAHHASSTNQSFDRGDPESRGNGDTAGDDAVAAEDELLDFFLQCSRASHARYARCDEEST